MFKSGTGNTAQASLMNFRIPLLVGGFAGALISLDAFIASYLHLMTYRSLSSRYAVSMVVFALGVIFIAGYIAAFKKTVWISEKKAAIFAVVLIISSQVKGLTSVGILDFSDLVIFLFLIVFLIEIFRDAQYKIIVTPLPVLILVFLFSMVLSFTSEVSAGRSSLVSLAAPVKWMVTILLIMNLIRSRKDALFSIKVFIIITIFSGIIGVGESLLYQFTGIGYHTGKFDFEITSLGTFIRAQAFFGHIHGLATFLTISLAFLFFLILASRKNILWKKWMLMSMFVIALIALVFTFYKAGLVAFVLLCIIGTYIRKPSYFIHITTALLIVISLLYLSGIGTHGMEIANYLSTGDLKSRLELDKEGIEGFLQEHPIVGAGLGNNRIYTPHPSAWPAHNAFIQVADEVGVIGLISYFLIYAYLFYKLLITNYLLRNTEDKIVIQALLLGFIGFFIIAQVEPLAVNFWFWMYFGLIECVTYTFLKAQRAREPVIEPQDA